MAKGRENGAIERDKRAHPSRAAKATHLDVSRELVPAGAQCEYHHAAHSFVLGQGADPSRGSGVHGVVSIRRLADEDDPQPSLRLTLVHTRHSGSSLCTRASTAAMSGSNSW